jgi:hypothetical protein
MMVYSSHEQHDLRELLLDEPASGPPTQLHLLSRAIDDDESFAWELGPAPNR